MFTNEQVKLVAGETLVSVHAVMATMFDFEGGNDPYTVADVIAAVINPYRSAPGQDAGTTGHGPGHGMEYKKA